MDYPRLKVIDHPLARHKLALMRDGACEAAKFRSLIYELGVMLCTEVTRTLDLAPWDGVSVEGRPVQGEVLDQWNVVVVPILRGGLVLAEGFAELLPASRSGHIGIYHDYETKSLTTYLVSVPSSENLSEFFVVDLLLGTGLSAIESVEILKKLNVPDRKIHFACLSCHEEGIKSFYGNPKMSNINIFTFEMCYNLYGDKPDFGFGPISDRLFGTGI